MKKFFPFIFSLILAVLVTRQIFLGYWYPMHDSTHVSRVTLMTESLRRGEFPPLWAASAGNGYGYPLFHFYAPLFHLSASIINLLTNDPYLSLKVTILLSTFIGALGIYFLAGSVGATAYLLSPYLAVNLYVRGAFSEYLALMLLPWLLLTLKDLSSRKKIAWAALALSFFILSHNLIPILILPIAFIWSFYFNKESLIRVIAAFFLAGLLVSWFLVPVIFEREFTQADAVAKTTHYALHFVEPSQIWNSTWGYGGSGPGVEDGMSFKLGKLQIILAALGLLLAFKRHKYSGLLLGSFALVLIYIATQYSQVFWEKIPLLQIVQFPWRALGPLAFILAVLAGFAALLLNNRILKIACTLTAICFIIFLNLKYFVPQSYEDSSTPVSGLVEVIPEYMPKDLVKYPLKPADPVPSKLYGPAKVSIDRAYYPTWEGMLNGNKIQLTPSAMGLVELDVPVGEYDFKLNQSRTKLELFSYAITLLALGYTVGLLKERV